MRRTQAPSNNAKRAKTNYSKKTSKPRGQVAIPYTRAFGKNAFPSQLRNTLTYTETVSFSLVSGFASYVFSANGLYDPNITGTGHQPYYFDQLMALYNHYTVLKSRIKVEFFSIDTTFKTYTVFLNDDASPNIGSGSTPGERPAAVSIIGNPSVAPVPPIYMSYDAVKTFGPNPLANDNLQGTSGANPTESQTYVLYVYDSYLSSSNVRAYVTINYECVWDEFADTVDS